MTKIKRDRSEIIGYLLWVLAPLVIFWNEIIGITHGEITYHDLNPVNFLVMLVVFSLAGYAFIEAFWSYRNPFAKIENGFIVICPRPFDKEIVKISDIVKFRESLQHEKQKIFFFHSAWTTWMLKIDLANSITLSIPLHHKKREAVIKFLKDNKIFVENASRDMTI